MWAVRILIQPNQNKNIVADTTGKFWMLTIFGGIKIMVSLFKFDVIVVMICLVLKVFISER